MKLQHLATTGVLLFSQVSLAIAAINDGLIAHYKLDDTSGPVIDSANSYHGTAENGVIRGVPGVVGNAFQFDGVNDYVSTTFGDGVTYPNGLTLSLWVNSTELGNSGLVTARGAGSGASSQFLGLNAGHINFGTPSVVRGVPGMNLGMGNPSEYYTVDFGSTINDNQWHHVVGSYDGASVLSVYVDGVRVSQSVSVSQTAKSFDVFKIGWDDFTTAESDRYLAGRIDDVRIWDRALSRSEIVALSLKTTPDPYPTITEDSLFRPDGSTARKAIVLVHGWKGSPSLFENGLAPAGTAMKQHIEESIDDTDWDVFTFNWSEDAAKENPQNPLELAPLPETRVAAAAQGRFLADELRRLGYDEHVHFVGHSLGGRVIDSATYSLVTDALWSGTVHETFLDAYTPFLGWANVFGSNADFAEHYYYSGRFPWITYPGDWPLTQADLPNAHNVDVTELIEPEWNVNNSARHKWPVGWYDRTAYQSNAVDAGYGFPLGLENPLNTTWPDLASYPRGETVELPLANAHGTPALQLANQQQFDPATQVINISDTGTVRIQPGLLSLGTGSPVWANMSLSTQGITNFVEFDFDFTGNADGVLTVYLDGAILDTFYERHALDGPQSSGMLFYDDLAAGDYVLSFRLDPLTLDTSSIDISAIRAGYLYQVPEPTGLVLFAVAAMAVLGRRDCRHRSQWRHGPVFASTTKLPQATC